MPTLRHLREAPPPAPHEMRVEITTPATDAPLQFALSPDGRSLVFVASGDGARRLWLRPLDQTEARPLTGTEGAISPFWSPDSRAVGFIGAGRLLRIDVSGGASQVLAIANGARSQSGSWGADGTILFSQQTTDPLLRVSAAGGEPVAFTRLDPPRQVGHGHPHFLPDGQHFLFATTAPPRLGGALPGVARRQRRRAADGGGPGWCVPATELGGLRATRDARCLPAGPLAGVLIGDPAILADRVGVEAYGHGGFAVSGRGSGRLPDGRGRGTATDVG